MDAPKPECLCYDLISEILKVLPSKIKIFILFEEVQPRLLRDHWEESGKRQDPRPKSSSTFLPAPPVPFRSYTRKISPLTKTNGKRFQRKLLQPYIVAVTELHKFTVGFKKNFVS